MAKGLKAAVAAAALGVGLLGAAGAARADIYDYTYTQVSQGTAIAGNLQANITGNGNNLMSLETIIIVKGTGSFNAIPQIGLPGLNLTSIDGMLSFQNSSGNFLAKISSNGTTGSAAAQGPILGNSASFSFGNSFNGLFSAFDAGPSSGGGSSGSGGAPSPEVNTLLGFLIVGGTVAFLKRRRRGGGAEDAAAA